MFKYSKYLKYNYYFSQVAVYLPRTGIFFSFVNRIVRRLHFWRNESQHICVVPDLNPNFQHLVSTVSHHQHQRDIHLVDKRRRMFEGVLV